MSMPPSLHNELTAAGLNILSVEDYEDRLGPWNLKHEIFLTASGPYVRIVWVGKPTDKDIKTARKVCGRWRFEWQS